MKTCTNCGTPKPPEQFYLIRGVRESRCKDCEKARRRHREHVRYTSVSDVTPEQELAMRKRARKCPLCGTFMTGKPGKPNSKHLDHILPLGVGGTHTHGNVRIICALCNLKRPKDGSDYRGMLTLWAAGEIPVGRPDGRRGRKTCRKGLHPWVPQNIWTSANGKRRCRECYRATARRRRKLLRPNRQCKCGALFPAPGSTLMCPDCTLTAVRTAIFLHLADELSWGEIATQVGYTSGTGIRDAAVRHGYTPDYWPQKGAAVKPATSCACGAAAYRHGRCANCIRAAAQRAVHLRTEEGWTLRMIADELGYSSISTVTNLMKTVIEIEPRMGRPPVFYR